MAIQTNAMAQAAQTLSQPIKTRRAPSAGRSVKKQPDAVKVTWDTASARLIDAVKAEGVAHNKWVQASDQLWILGVRPAALEQVTVNGKKQDSETYQKVEQIVQKGFSARVQSLLAVNGAGLSGLTEAERGERRYWVKRTPVMMQRVIQYLKRHEENERGTTEKKTLSQQVAKIIKKQIERIEKAEAEKVSDFNVPEVLSLLRQAVAELT
jgi:hypothetical protein